jgi:hypothetical protein
MTASADASSGRSTAMLHRERPKDPYALPNTKLPSPVLRAAVGGNFFRTVSCLTFRDVFLNHTIRDDSEMVVHLRNAVRRRSAARQCGLGVGR